MTEKQVADLEAAAPEGSLYKLLGNPMVAMVAWPDGRLAMETTLESKDTIAVLERMIHVLRTQKPDKVIGPEGEVDDVD